MLSSGARLPVVLPIRSREIWSGLLSSRCAMPISTTSTPGTSCACARSGGSGVPSLVGGVAPSVRSRSVSTSGATSVSPGGVRKDCKSGPADRRRIADFHRDRDRFDAEQPERASVDLNAAFEHGRDRPAGAAQLGEELLREGRRRSAPPAWRYARRRRWRRRGRNCRAPARSAPARRSTGRSRKSARSAKSQAASDAAANGSTKPRASRRARLMRSAPHGD